MTCYTVPCKIYDVELYRIQEALRGQRCRAHLAQAQSRVIKTPGTRIQWSTLKDWMGAWKQIKARAASSKRHEQRAAHIAELASNMSVINCEKDIETLAAVKHLIEREHLLPPRGMREGHPATEILQRVGTVLNERRRVAAEGNVDANKTRWKAAA